jgi:hypothetical protein
MCRMARYITVENKRNDEWSPTAMFAVQVLYRI